MFYKTRKDAWRDGKIDFTEYLLHKHYRNEVFSLIFERYVRMKGFLWPYEVNCFIDKMIAKHPNIKFKSFQNDYPAIEHFGAYYQNGKVMRLFGGANYNADDGILYGEPYTPKKNHDVHFIKLAIKQIKYIQKDNDSFLLKNIG